MTEKKFIEQNIEKWRELEDLLSKSDQNPEKLHRLFIKVSSDLSYARTYFPNRSVRLYLNNLTQSVFDTLGKKKNKFSLEPVKRFFGHILPLEIYRSRKAFYVSLVVFVLAMAIGVISSAYNPDFATVILGEDYIDMTDKNINDGDPMRVYKDADQVDMFFGITTNNIRVALIAFVFGFFGSVGTIFVLISNGIMVGAFQYYFYTKGLFITSFLTIWCHGTIEISAIILAGAAGIILGNGILFPGTYKRSTSLQISGMRALRIVLATVPLFVIAGMLESFVTRLTEMPTMVKILIIVGSLALILFMWVFYPWYYHRHVGNEISDVDIIPFADDPELASKMSYRGFESNIALSIIHYKKYFGQIASYLWLPFMIITSFLLWFSIQAEDVLDIIAGFSLFYYEQSNLLLFFTYLIGTAFFVAFVSHRYLDEKKTDILVHVKRNFLAIILVTVGLVFPFYFVQKGIFVFLIYLIMTPHFLVILTLRFGRTRHVGFSNNVRLSIKESFKFYFYFLPQYLIGFIFFAVTLLLLLETGVGSIIKELFMWHQIFDNGAAATTFFYHISFIISFFVAMPFLYFSIADKYYSLLCRTYSYDLEQRFEKFGKSSAVFEMV